MKFNPLNPILLAELLHTALGALFYLGPIAIWGKVIYGYYGIVFILSVDTVKEFTYDLVVEKETILDGFIDLGFYGLGALGAVLAQHFLPMI